MLRRKLTQQDACKHNWFMLMMDVVSKTIGFDLEPVKPQNLTDNEFTVVVKPHTDDGKTSDPE